MRLVLLLFLLISIALPINAFSYEVNVHRAMTEYALSASTVQLYLLNNLGIRLLEDKFKAENALEWIKDGSEWEDGYGPLGNVTTNWLNHFYDPATGQGLNANGMAFGQPSLVWGNDYYANLWNWHWARDAFHNALTNPAPDLRQFYYAKLFRSLGQVMHLVQDLASPAHVRNDPHNAPVAEADTLHALQQPESGLQP